MKMQTPARIILTLSSASIGCLTAYLSGSFIVLVCVALVWGPFAALIEMLATKVDELQGYE